jgi:hypothetical protein
MLDVQSASLNPACEFHGQNLIDRPIWIDPSLLPIEDTSFERYLAGFTFATVLVSTQRTPPFAP